MHCEDPFTCSSKSFEESRAGLIFAYELRGRLLGSGDDPTVTDKANYRPGTPFEMIRFAPHLRTQGA
jgi:hypothetical protein